MSQVVIFGRDKLVSESRFMNLKVPLGVGSMVGIDTSEPRIVPAQLSRIWYLCLLACLVIS